ncbi:MAG: hypothetical protein E7480_08050 [Ruminococcaceae bacterium]|nr:hypothetical protein [Oscillospiraceae bacterium]
MARFELHIDIDTSRMEQSLLRMQRRVEFKYHDRVPINFCVEPRFFAPLLNVKLCEIFKDPETQFVYLLKFAKMHAELLNSDFLISPVIYINPWFDNVIQASAFGCEIYWPENETLQAIPFMQDVSEIEKMKIPEVDSGLWGRRIEWFFKMQEFCKDTRLTIGHGSNIIEGRVEMAPFSQLVLGPHMVAVDMAGTEFYYWMAEYPEECHKMLEKITLDCMAAEDYARKIDPRPRYGIHLAEDSSTILSPDMFREMVVPYTKRCYDRYSTGPDFARGLHMCGPSTHLLEILADDLKINSFNMFGCPVDPKDVARTLGGKSLLWGNIDPVLIKDGTKEQVKEACRKVIEVLAPCGGFMLGDGANVCPGTPIENLLAFAEAAEEYGVPENLR